MKPNKPIILLKALLQGQIIEAENCKYKLVNDELCRQFTRVNTITNKEYKTWLPIAPKIKSFIDWTNSFTNEEAFLISANTALTDINREKYEK